MALTIISTLANSLKNCAIGGEFLEWAEFAGNCYGTPIAPVLDRLEAGEDILLEIELQGARQVMQRCPQAYKVFISPPSLEELERRLRDRSSDSEESIVKRLQVARVELQATHEFDVTVVNDNLEETLAELERLVFGESLVPEGSASKAS